MFDFSILVFPAGAGVIHLGSATANVEKSFPRRCGGDPKRVVTKEGS